MLKIVALMSIVVSIDLPVIYAKRLTVCVTCAGAGTAKLYRPEKYQGVGKCLRLSQNPRRQVHALLGNFTFAETPIEKTLSQTHQIFTHNLTLGNHQTRPAKFTKTF